MKRIIILILVVCLTGSFAGCTAKETAVTVKEDTQNTKTPESHENTVGSEDSAKEGSSGNESTVLEETSETDMERLTFSEKLAAFLQNEKGMDKQNFLVSPTSLRAALCLAVSGADTETKQELLEACGFSSEDEMLSWYASVQKSVKSFEDEKERCASYGTDAKDTAFRVLNSVWTNTSNIPGLKPSYTSYVTDRLDAVSDSASKEQITGKVNAWADRSTEGLIPSIADDLSETGVVLVNALYLKNSWMEEFEEARSENKAFHNLDGSESDIRFMNRTDSYAYAENDGKRMIVLPMLLGGMRLAVMTGSNDFCEMEKLLEESSVLKVSLSIPAFEIESGFLNGELVEFLKSEGASLAFTDGKADFSRMCDETLVIDDIVQKTRIKTDEKGLEAAAVTAVMMKNTSISPEAPIDFTVDEPFLFAVLDGDEPLFIGRFVQAGK